MVFSVMLFSSVIVMSSVLGWSAEKEDYFLGRKNIIALYLWLIVLILTFVCGFRDVTVGADTHTYRDAFLLYGDYPAIEKGFGLFVKVLMTLYYDPTVVFVVVSLLTNAFFVFGLWRLRFPGTFGWVLVIFDVFIYFLTFSGMRQYLAVSICFYFSTFLFSGKRRDYIVFIIACTIAAAMHTSALMMIAYLPLVMYMRVFVENQYDVDRAVKMISGVIVAGICFFVVKNVFIDNYSSLASHSKNIDVRIGLMVPFKILLLLIIVFEMKNTSKSDMLFFIGPAGKTHWLSRLPKVKKYFQIRYVIATYCVVDFIYLGMCFVGYYFKNVDRIGWYFSPFETVLYGYLLSRSRYIRYTIQGAMIVISVVYTYYVMFQSGGNHTVPFRFTF